MTASIIATRILTARDVSLRRRRRKPRHIAVLAFLTLAAVFFLVPLYVIVVTSLKSMDEIRQGEIFALPARWSLDAWSFAWSEVCAGMSCGGMKVGFFNSLFVVAPAIFFSMSVGSVTGYALALWQIRWANAFLFSLFICAFVPFQIIMYPLIKITAAIGIYGSTFGIGVVHAALLMPIVTLIFNNFYKDIPRELISAAMVDWPVLEDFFRDYSADVWKHLHRGADSGDHERLERFSDWAHIRHPRQTADDDYFEYIGQQRDWRGRL